MPKHTCPLCWFSFDTEAELNQHELAGEFSVRDDAHPGNSVDNEVETVFTVPMTTSQSSFGSKPGQLTNGYGTTTTSGPTYEQTAANHALLLTTNIPYLYRAAVAEADHHKRVAGASTRPSNAKTRASFHQGRVIGIVDTVQAMFGYFFHAEAADLLDAVVKSLES